MISYFRNCNHCGLGYFHQLKSIDFFCEKCWVKLEKEKAPIHTVIFKTPEVKVRSLFIWKSQETIVGDLILGLKGGTPEKILTKLSIEMAKRFYTEERAIIIPVPSSKVGEIDHAHKIAKCLAETLNFELWDGLVWKNKSQNQKFLSKTERFVSQMEKIQRISRKSRVILIDDLVTTGATALAARKAIQGLNQIEVWALACRI